MEFEALMHLALEQAKLSGDEVPVGAVLVDGNYKVVAISPQLERAAQGPNLARRD